MTKLKIKSRLAKCEETFWTGRVGTVFATYEELVKKLGKPHNRTEKGKWESRDGKTRHEWAFVVNRNKDNVVTIYDYKCKLPVEKIKEWSLGARWEKDFIPDFLDEKRLSYKI